MIAALRRLFRRPAPQGHVRTTAPEDPIAQATRELRATEHEFAAEVDAAVRNTEPHADRDRCWMCDPATVYLDGCMCGPCLRRYVDSGGPIPYVPTDPGDPR